MTSILVVCTGNICRSPLAEQLLRSRFAAAAVRVTVRSAGTYATVGDRMTRQAEDLSLRYGGDPSGHRPQQLTAELVAGVDLVLTATREHRGETVSLHPLAARYSYTINEFARLVSGASPVEAPTIRAFLAAIAALRGQTPPPSDPRQDDIEDPYRRSQDVYDRVGLAVDAATSAIVSGFIAAGARS